MEPDDKYGLKIGVIIPAEWRTHQRAFWEQFNRAVSPVELTFTRHNNIKY